MLIDRTIYPRPENWKEIFVRTFLGAEARGCCVMMGGLIENADEEVMSCGDEDLITQYVAFKERAKAAFAYETVHGEGSLLKRDDPLIKRLVGQGILRLPAAA